MMSEWDVVLRLVASIFCGAVIGWEREWRSRPAGFQTQTMVCVGTCLYTILSLVILDEYSTTDERSQIDPTRLIQGITAGIGFLGAGCILQSQGSIRGLTTAATVWFVGAMGVACGIGMFLIAGMGLVAAMIVLVPMRVLEKKVITRKDKP